MTKIVNRKMTYYIGNYKVFRQVSSIDIFFKQMCYFCVLKFEKFNKIKEKVSKTNNIDLSKIIEHIRNFHYTGFVPPQNFILYTDDNGYCWIDSNMRCPDQVTVEDIGDIKDNQLHDYLYNYFKDKPLSGYFILIKEDAADLCTYLPYYKDEPDFVVFK